MALLYPVAGATLTQGWGPTRNIYEPDMWSGSGDAASEAYWLWTAKLDRQYGHFHPGLDFAAPIGSPILACESGVVVLSDYDRISGFRVRVEIRPGVQYGSGHMMARGAPLGAHVGRGQHIGAVGSSGTATGPHDHFFVEIRNNLGQSIINDPTLFLPGGKLAGDGRIQPFGPTPPPPTPGIPTFPHQVNFAAGTYVGHQFASTGATVAVKPYTLTRASSAPASMRSRIVAQPGWWLYITSGIWAGFWVEEGPGISY
jgi:hypothetical protein